MGKCGVLANGKLHFYNFDRRRQIQILGNEFVKSGRGKSSNFRNIDGLHLYPSNSAVIKTNTREAKRQRVKFNRPRAETFNCDPLILSSSTLTAKATLKLQKGPS